MTTKVVYGFKGFECLELTPEGKQRLKCKDQWYTVGETAHFSGDIVMCSCGFHFCKELHNVHSYYALGTSIVARVLIPIGGHLIEGEDKCVTNSLHVEALLSGKFESGGNSYVFEHGRLTHWIGADGSQEWWKDGKLHRDGDLPAIIRGNGTQEWWKDGKEHRDGDMPAIIWYDGTQSWWKNGNLHRDGDLPAIIWAHGEQEWWKDGKFIAKAAATLRRSNEVDAFATQRVRIKDATAVPAVLDAEASKAESAPKATEGSANVPFATQRVRIEDATAGTAVLDVETSKAESAPKVTQVAVVMVDGDQK